jgi:hypothetical protein
MYYMQIYQYLTDNSLLSEHQFGFRKYHSTASALLDSTNSWYVNMDRKMFNLVVLLDLKKAFAREVPWPWNDTFILVWS